jgi:phosphoribosylformimino-5-aminoimidazole carboxamide ribotide isomerase
MQIIPVIDIKNGIAVHAKGGHRERYAALETRFADVPEPTAIIAGMLTVLKIARIYIADLDAITKSADSSARAAADNNAMIRQLARDYPNLDFMIDSGLTVRSVLDDYLQHDNLEFVIASETLSTLQDYNAVMTRIPATRGVLSLDRRGDRRLGPAALFERPSMWPQRVINMNLACVGGDDGPDWDGLEALRARCPDCHIYAAGGVRDLDDLGRLVALGTTAVLIGSALHDGRLDPAAVAKFADSAACVEP